MATDEKTAEMVETVDPTSIPVSIASEEVEDRHVSFQLIILTAVCSKTPIKRQEILENVADTNI